MFAVASKSCLFWMGEMDEHLTCIKIMGIMLNLRVAHLWPMHMNL